MPQTVPPVGQQPERFGASACSSPGDCCLVLEQTEQRDGTVRLWDTETPENVIVCRARDVRVFVEAVARGKFDNVLGAPA